jgi:hypothetical protein
LVKESVRGAYFFEWGQLRKLMRKHGVAPATCDARRHELHVEVLGYDKSHKKFDTRETNLVIAKFRELSGSINRTDYERGNRIYVIRQLCAALGKGEAYAQGIADQMDNEGRLLSGPIRRAPGQTKGEHDMAIWEAELQRGPVSRRQLHHLKPEELDKVIVALRKHKPEACVHEHTSNPQRVGDLATTGVRSLHVETSPAEEEDLF